MSIHFNCNRCHQLLGIADRKAGTGIECPKCGHTQVVPNREAVEATKLMGQIAGTPQVDDDPADLVVYDDEPAAIDSPRRRKKKQEKNTPPVEKTTPTQRPKKTKKTKNTKKKTKQPAPAKTAEQQPSPQPSPEAQPSPEPQPSPSPQPGKPLPSGMILFPRRSFYVQAVLLVILAGVAVAGGYFMGRGDANYEIKMADEELDRQSMEIKGKLVHDTGTGLVPDENGVVMAFPIDKLPEKALSSNKLGPHSRPPDETDESLKAIVAFGGAYCRADATGDFSMVVPDLGTYRILVISRNAKRPKDVELDEADFVEIEEYLSGAKRLIGRGKYRWTREEVTARLAPIEVNFGQSGKP
jgi:DNA-directed RNA polymerase subunit RPC12/RpoP